MAKALFGKDVDRWHSALSGDPVRAARLLAGRRAVHDLVQDFGLFPWSGFEPTAPGQKPALSQCEADFSIAHSGELLLVAVVPSGAVGADLELHDVEFDNPALIRRMCTTSEIEALQRLEPGMRRAWLARLWTAKEAVVKRDGVGLRQDFRLLELGHEIAAEASNGLVPASIATRSNTGSVGHIWHPEIRRESAEGSETHNTELTAQPGRLGAAVPA
jgi:4'-phosphopantetheinyl transferase